MVHAEWLQQYDYQISRVMINRYHLYHGIHTCILPIRIIDLLREAGPFRISKREMTYRPTLHAIACTRVHRRMGTLWLGGQRG